MKLLADDVYEEEFLYDSALARRRIGEEGKKYGANNVSDLILKSEDFKKRAFLQIHTNRQPQDISI